MNQTHTENNSQKLGRQTQALVYTARWSEQNKKYKDRSVTRKRGARQPRRKTKIKQE